MTTNSESKPPGEVPMESEREYTGAQMVMEAFLREGVDTIFGVPGGANLPLYDVLESGGVGIQPLPPGVEPKIYPIKHYLVKHEQCAAHAADAYSRVTGKAGAAQCSLTSRVMCSRRPVASTGPTKSSCAATSHASHLTPTRWRGRPSSSSSRRNPSSFRGTASSFRTPIRKCVSWQRRPTSP